MSNGVAHFEIDLPLSAEAPGIARRVTAAALRSWQVPARLPDVLVVVTELVENAVEHAGTHTETVARLRLELALVDAGRTLRVAVADPALTRPVLRPID